MSVAGPGATGAKRWPRPNSGCSLTLPAAISSRGTAPSAVRLVPLADSVAGVRLHAPSRLVRAAVTQGVGVAWRGGSPRGRCGRSCARAAAGDGGEHGFCASAAPGVPRAHGRARRIHRGVWGVRGRTGLPRGYPMRRREVSGIRGVSAGCGATWRLSSLSETFQG